MLRAFKIKWIVIVVILELVFITTFCNQYPHGMVADVTYRHTERFAALADYMEHHSTETRAAYDRELVLMHQHEDWKGYVAWGLLLAANLVSIYFFVCYKPGPGGDLAEDHKNGSAS